MMRDFAGKNILVLEDDYLLATDIARAVRATGAGVAGPFAKAPNALDLIARTPPDGALLDVNLGRGSCFEVARALDKLGVPFAFVTGYESVPDEWRHVPFVAKPFERRDIERVLTELSFTTS